MTHQSPLDFDRVVVAEAREVETFATGRSPLFGGGPPSRQPAHDQHGRQHAASERVAGLIAAALAGDGASLLLKVGGLPPGVPLVGPWGADAIAS